MTTSLRTATALLLAAAAVLVDGCSCDKVPTGAVTDCEMTPPVPTSVRTDILFVIDDSGSMAGEQQRLRDGLTRFINTLADSPVQHDIQIGVTNTSVAEFNGDTAYQNGPSGAPRNVPYPAGTIVAVSALVDPLDTATWGDFLWDGTQGFYGTVAEPRILAWSDPNLIPAFSRNVLVGTNGSGREQPFAAMESALTTLQAAGEKNEGFLRPDARLAVVFLSDEDDCSGPVSGAVQSDGNCDTERAKIPTASALTSIDHYVSILQGTLAGQAREVVLGAVVGVTCTGGICTNALCTGARRTPIRYLELLGNFDSTRTVLASICDNDFDATLTEIACMLVPQDVPLDGAPADWRMMTVALTGGAATIPCEVAIPGGANEATAGVVYHAPSGGQPATLHFQNSCRLGCGKRIEIALICAG
jgi:hypothetical protein